MIAPVMLHVRTEAARENEGGLPPPLVRVCVRVCVLPLVLVVGAAAAVTGVNGINLSLCRQPRVNDGGCGWQFHVAQLPDGARLQ